MSQLVEYVSMPEEKKVLEVIEPKEKISICYFISQTILNLVDEEVDNRPTLLSLQTLLDKPQEDRQATCSETAELKEAERRVELEREYYERILELAKESSKSIKQHALSFLLLVIAVIVGYYMNKNITQKLKDEGTEEDEPRPEKVFLYMFRFVMSGPMIIWWAISIWNVLEEERDKAYETLVVGERPSTEDPDWVETVHLSEVTKRQKVLVDTLHDDVEPKRMEVGMLHRQYDLFLIIFSNIFSCFCIIRCMISFKAVLQKGLFLDKVNLLLFFVLFFITMWTTVRNLREFFIMTGVIAEPYKNVEKKKENEGEEDLVVEEEEEMDQNQNEHEDEDVKEENDEEENDDKEDDETDEDDENSVSVLNSEFDLGNESDFDEIL